jgi:acetolactate synthase-1/2/3 large subunit
MLGMHGTAYANKAVADCDLIMAIGARWDDRITGKLEEFCTGAVKIHVDIDAAEFDKIVQPDVAIHGDARLVIEDLVPLIEMADTEAWLAQCERWRRDYRDPRRRASGDRGPDPADRDGGDRGLAGPV